VPNVFSINTSTSAPAHSEFRKTYQVLREYNEYPCNLISECTFILPKCCNHFPSSSSLSLSVGTNNPFSGISTALSFPFEVVDEVERTLNDLVGE